MNFRKLYNFRLLFLCEIFPLVYTVSSIPIEYEKFSHRWILYIDGALIMYYHSGSERTFE